MIESIVLLEGRGWGCCCACGQVGRTRRGGVELNFYEAGVIAEELSAHVFAIDRPDDMDVNEIVFSPTRQVL